jgi:hypothetical protein
LPSCRWLRWLVGTLSIVPHRQRKRKSGAATVDPPVCASLLEARSKIDAPAGGASLANWGDMGERSSQVTSKILLFSNIPAFNA